MALLLLSFFVYLHKCDGLSVPVPYRSFHLVPTTDDEQSSFHRAHMVRALTSEECSWVVDEAEAYVAKNLKGVWTTDRHMQFPTTDFAVAGCPTLRPYLSNVVQERVLPFLSKEYGVRSTQSHA